MLSSSKSHSFSRVILNPLSPLTTSMSLNGNFLIPNTPPHLPLSQFCCTSCSRAPYSSSSPTSNSISPPVSPPPLPLVLPSHPMCSRWKNNIVKPNKKYCQSTTIPLNQIGPTSFSIPEVLLLALGHA